MPPSLTFLGHSTVRLELAGTTVLTDPLLTAGLGPVRRVVPAPTPQSWAGVDLVLLSHLHNDHLHLPSLRLLGRRTPVVVPRGAGRWLAGKGFTAVSELAPGEQLRHGGLTITGTPARHAGHRWGPRLTAGPHAPAIGHLICGDGLRVYASGDTDLFPELTGLGDDGVDVAVLPVSGWGLTLGPGHLDPRRAAEAVSRLRPRVVLPVHWGTLAVTGLLHRGSPWRHRMRAVLSEPPLQFASLVAAGGSGARVAVTEPGGVVPLTGVRTP